jgi:dihydrofolate synthase/folylpolyglutamate synthase
MKFGLHGIQTLLLQLGHPDRQFQSIHIAGTNGKGSTASMIAAMFTAAGYKTGLYTSPHLIKFNERIRINGEPIPSRTVARLTTAVRSGVKKNNITFFETVTAMAFKYFAESKVDIAIVETGLGGRLDATNVLRPLVSVITTIGLEHTQILGSSLEKIAYEKGGIIKKGIPCVSGVTSSKSLRVLKKISIARRTKLLRINSKNKSIRHASLEGSSVDFTVGKEKLHNVEISLAGQHQATNALIAINAVYAANRSGEFRVGEKAVRGGLKNIQQYSGLSARLSIVKKNPLVIADVAHNPEAVGTLCASLERLRLGKMNIVIGLMQDKDYMKIVPELRKMARKVFVVEARTDRSRSAADLVKEFRRLEIKAECFNNVVSGFSSALRRHEGAPILITGSHFVVGEGLAYLKMEKYLTINQ